MAQNCIKALLEIKRRVVKQPKLMLSGTPTRPKYLLPRDAMPAQYRRLISKSAFMQFWAIFTFLHDDVTRFYKILPQ